jgi:alkylhydroperoxidase/carboxymuconolactone decarboxylase family protein YurZ
MKPPSPETIRKHFPGVLEGHQALQRAAAGGGPLDERMRELILLAAFTVGRQEGGFKSHCRRALRAGATPDEVRQAVVITMSNVASIEVVADALLWADEVIAAEAESGQPAGAARAG